MRALIAIVLSVIFLSMVLNANSYAQECTRYRPTLVLSPSTITGPPDTVYLFVLSVTNTDTQLCGSTTFDITPSLPNGWIYSSLDSVAVFPGETEIVPVYIAVPSDAAKRQEQVIIAVSSPDHQDPNLKNSVSSSVTIKNEPKVCTLYVNDITFRKADTDVEKTKFCLKEKIDVGTKISLKGNAQARVFADLFVAGKLVDSKEVDVFPDNFATLNFNNSIDTQAFGKSTQNVKVVAKTACASSEATMQEQLTIDVCDPSCLFTTSIAAPLEKEVGQDILTSIYTRNIGNKENLIAIEPALCYQSI